MSKTDRYVVGSSGGADVAVIDTETGEHAPFYDMRGTAHKTERAATVAANLNGDLIERAMFVWKA